MKKKIFELKIDLDDELSGIDSISLVDEPAIEINWLAFKKDHECYVPDGKDSEYLKLFENIGEPEQNLFDDGFIVESIEPVKYEEFGLAPTSPNEVSVDDEDFYRVRYKYDVNSNVHQNPIILTTREYCRTLINKNFVFRIEELMNLPPNSDAEDGGWGGNPMVWRGGYNCRHYWWKIKYRKDSKIVNKGSVNIGKETDVAGRPIETDPNWNQPSTVTAPTLNNPSPTTVRNLGLSKFSIDNEKRIVVGPAMIPNMEIFRRDLLGKEYWVYFSEETIKNIAEKYMKNGFNISNDIDHNGKKTKDVYVVESWIKEGENDKSILFEEFKDLPIGTWFVTMKVNNDNIWNKVKNHELNGFSVSGYFEEHLVQMEREQLFLEELAKLLKMKKGE